MRSIYTALGLSHLSRGFLKSLMRFWWMPLIIRWVQCVLLGLMTINPLLHRSTIPQWTLSKSLLTVRRILYPCITMVVVSLSKCIRRKASWSRNWSSAICESSNLPFKWLTQPPVRRLAGSNFDDDQKKLTGGRNGYGAKLANIYSHEFSTSILVFREPNWTAIYIVVETADKVNSKKYKQMFSNNMSKKGIPKV